jgi:hypothetical protein
VLDARTAADRGANSLANQTSWGSVSVVAGGSIADYADTNANIYANAVRLQAGGGIGASGAAFETEALLMSAKAGAAGAYLTELSDVLVTETGPISVARPDADGTVPGTPGSVADALQVGIDSGGVLVLLAGGQLQTNKAVQATGNLLLASGGVANLVTGDLVRSTGGNLQLQAAGSMTLNGDVATQGLGSTMALYATGSLLQAQTTAATTNNGNIAVVAGGTLTVELFSAGTAAIHASAAAIVDVDTDLDFSAASLRLLGTNGVGSSTDSIETEATLLAAVSSAGAVLVTEATAVTVGAVGNVLVQEVQAGGGVVGFNHTGGTGLAGTDIVLTTTNGALTLGASGSALATGNLLLQAGGGTSGLAINAGVTASATNGSMSLVAVDQVTVSGTVSVIGSGTLDVRAGRVNLAEGSAVSTQGGDVAILATGNVTIESIDAGTGGVRIAGNRVDDGDALNDTEVDIVAARLAINATDRIGLSTNALETNVGAASIRAGAAAFVTESNTLLLDTVSVTVNQVGTGGAATTPAAMVQSNNVATTFVLRTLAGSLTSTANGAITAGGNLLLDVGGATSDLTTGAEVKSTGGSISLHAGNRLLLNADVTTTTGSATIEMQAGADLVQAQTTSITTANGSVLLAATGSATIERISAGAGRVHVTGAAIVDGDSTVGDTEIDILANGVLLTATNGSVGEAGNALEATTSTLSAKASQGGSVFITETDGVDLGTVALSVNFIAANGVATLTSTGAQSGVTGADVVVRTLVGPLAVLAGNAVDATADLLLQAGGTGDLTVGAQVRSTGGSLSLVAGGAMTLNASVLNTTAGADGTVDLRAAGAITQAQTLVASTAGANMAVESGGVATLSKLDAGSGNLRVSATSIVDADAPGADDADFIAAGLKLEATTAIGASGAALETTVTTLAANAAAGSIFLAETDALTVGSVQVDVRHVDTAGAAPVQGAADAALAGLSSGLTTVLQTVNGLLAIDAGAAVVTGGNLLLAAGGTGSDLTVAASVTAAGAVSLSSGRNTTLSSTLTTTGSTANTIDVVSGGTLTTQQGSAIATAGGNVLLQATGDLTIESVNAGAGSVRLAGANVLDGDTGANETEVDVVASQLQIDATGAIGGVGNALETTVTTLSANAAGSITVAETDALVIDGTSVSVNRVLATGATTATTAAVQSDITSTGQGSIALSAGGSISLPAGADVRTGGAATISLTSATGSVLMQAADPGHSVIETGSGDIHVTAEGDIRPGALITQGKAFLNTRQRHDPHRWATCSATARTSTCSATT